MKKLQQDLLSQPDNLSNITFIDDILYQKNDIILSLKSSLKSALLEEFHSSPTRGHVSTSKTFNHLNANFISKCSTCQSTKYVTKLPVRLLQPLDLPMTLWEDISMDFIIGLPSYQGQMVVLVVVNRFLKACHLGILPPNFTAYKTFVFSNAITGFQGE